MVLDRTKGWDEAGRPTPQPSDHPLKTATRLLADILAYLATMRPLTGADYKRQTFGAGASDLRSATAELVTEGRIGVAVVDYFGYSKKDYKSLTKPKSNRLSENECNLIREVVNSVCGNQASEIGDFNCQMVWSSVPIGDRIPYYAAFALFPAELTDEDIADAVQQAHQIAPLILAEFAHDRGVL